MQIFRSEVTRLFAIGFLAGTLMVGATMATDWDSAFAPEAKAQTAPAQAE